MAKSEFGSDGGEWHKLTTTSCVPCTFQSRCIGSICVGNSTGVGCSQCITGFFGVGADCIKCPEGSLQENLHLLAVIGGSVVVMIVLWKMGALISLGPQNWKTLLTCLLN